MVNNRQFEKTSNKLVFLILTIFLLFGYLVYSLLRQGGIAWGRSQMDWDVSIIQDGDSLPIGEDGRVKIKRAPFTFQVRLPETFIVMLSVLDHDKVYQYIRPGLSLENCFDETSEINAFCPGTGIAESRDSDFGDLLLSDEGIHYLYYLDDKDNRWSRVDIQKNSIVFERHIWLFKDEDDLFNISEVAIEESPYEEIFLVFWVDYYDIDRVNVDEIKKVILSFK